MGIVGQLSQLSRDAFELRSNSRSHPIHVAYGDVGDN